MENGCKQASGSLDDSLTNIQWLYHLDLPENLLGHKTPNLNAETKAKMEEGSNKKETEPSPKNPHSKPSYSYSTLILLAINSSRQKKMTLQEIYKWIEDNFPYYKKCKKAWKNSIRHNLSLHSYFIKEQRPSSLPGKGNYWCLSSEGKENIVKEVLKHSQPVLQIPCQIQNSAVGSQSVNGLRPILPKPSIDSSTSLSSSGIMGNIGILANGVQYSLPVVFVTNTGGAHDSISAKPQGVDNEQVPKCTEGVGVMASESQLPFVSENKNSKHSLIKQNSTEYEIPSEKKTKVEEPIPNVMMFSQTKEEAKNRFPLQHSTEVNCVQEEFSSCVAQSRSDKNENSSILKRHNLSEKKEQLGSSPKKAKQFNHKKTSPRLQVCGTCCSPFSNCSQPTLAAINSQANDGVGTGSECRQFFEDFRGMASSPVKPISTPLKESFRGSLNTPNWLSPLGSSYIGFNTKTGFTPLKYDSDSGFFTPVKDSEFDFNFLLSPNRLEVDPSPRSKTKEGCRKSLHLGAIKEDESESETLLDWLQI